jgi:hypothetical protein
MSFVSGFNLTASVSYVVTFGRVKHSTHRLCGRHLQLLRETSGTGADISSLAFVRNGNKLIGVTGDDVDANEKQYRLNSFRGQIARRHIESNGRQKLGYANASCRSLSDVPTGDRMNVLGSNAAQSPPRMAVRES